MQIHWALIKWGSLAVSVGSLALALFLMSINSRDIVIAEKPEQLDRPSEQPQTRVDKPLIVEHKGDRVVWRLHADAANQQFNGMYLTKPGLEVFTDSGEQIKIHGEESWFEPLRKNISFKKKVRIEYRDWVLTSQSIRYDSGREELVIPGKFVAKRRGTSLRGGSLRVDRRTEQVTVDHDVRLDDESTWSVKRGSQDHITISSDAMKIDHHHQVATFTGNVHLQQAEFEMNSDLLTIHYRQQQGGELERAEASGHVDMRQGTMRGMADRAMFQQSKGVLILTGNARFEDEGGMIQGEKIIHDLNGAGTTVEQGEQGGRAHMVIDSVERIPEAGESKP